MTDNEKRPATDALLTPVQAVGVGSAVGALGGLWLAQFALVGRQRPLKQDFARVLKVTAGAAFVGAAAAFLPGVLARHNKERAEETRTRTAHAAGPEAAWIEREATKRAADPLTARNNVAAR
jgi:hypothetical protein